MCPFKYVEGLGSWPSTPHSGTLFLSWIINGVNCSSFELRFLFVLLKLGFATKHVHKSRTSPLTLQSCPVYSWTRNCPKRGLDASKVGTLHFLLESILECFGFLLAGKPGKWLTPYLLKQSHYMNLQRRVAYFLFLVCIVSSNPCQRVQ